MSSLHQFGGRVGGPIVIPACSTAADKAFFFFNYESSASRPSDAHADDLQRRARSRAVPLQRDGRRRAQLQTSTCWRSRRPTGQLATLDPIVARAARERFAPRPEPTGTITRAHQPEHAAVTSTRAPAPAIEHPPDDALDVNLTSNHRLSGDLLWQQVKPLPGHPQQRRSGFPGFADVAGSRPGTATVGSARCGRRCRRRMVNELRGGWQWSPLDFSRPTSTPTVRRPGRIQLELHASAVGLTDPTATSDGPSSRATRRTGTSTTR